MQVTPMRKLTILLFSILISFNSYGEWTKVSSNKSEKFEFYIDKDTIRENGGYVYYWELGNSLKPVAGSLSAKFYNEADCGIKRVRTLTYIFYKKPMGKDEISEVSEDNPKWDYPQPGTIRENLVDYACNYVK